MKGCAIAQVADHCPVTTEALRGIYGQQNVAVGNICFKAIWFFPIIIIAPMLYSHHLNLLTHNDPYSGRTAPLTSKRCILYIYSTNTGTEYFKHGIYSPFFSSSKCSLFHNSNVFGSCIIHILYAVCAEIKKNNSKRLRTSRWSLGTCKQSTSL